MPAIVKKWGDIPRRNVFCGLQTGFNSASLVQIPFVLDSSAKLTNLLTSALTENQGW
jgi:hypothetical protein